MMNVTGTKKIISAILLGSLLAAGAAVYADTQSDTRMEKGQQNSARTEQRGDRHAELLSKLVSEGIITADEKTVLEKALENQRPEAGSPPASDFAGMAEDGLISEALADRIDAYMEAQHKTAFANEVKPLVDAGTFPDAKAVQAALDAVREAMKDRLDALKPSGEREKVDFKSLTEAERTELKEKMEAERAVMQEKQDAAIKEIYSDLIGSGKLNQAQADALQSLMKNHEHGGRGHGPGFGEHPVKASEDAE